MSTHDRSANPTRIVEKLLALKEAAFPRTEVVIRDREGNQYVGIAQDIAAGLIMAGIPKVRRDAFMRETLAGGGRPPSVSPDTLKKLLTRGVLKKYVHQNTPSAPRAMSPSAAKSKLLDLARKWAREARSDWEANNDDPEMSIEHVAPDLGQSFLWVEGVQELIEASGMNPQRVAMMAAEMLP